MYNKIHTKLKKLSGPIPKDIKGLTNLRFLQLDNNQLTGTIPSEIGLATNLSKYIDDE